MTTIHVKRLRHFNGEPSIDYLAIFADGSISWTPNIVDAYPTFTDLAALWLFVLPKEEGTAYSLVEVKKE